jgi:serine/threonine protein kinase
MIQEFASNGDLRSYLGGFANQPNHADAPTPAMQLSMALDMARGMAYLHSQCPPLLHRDLKTPNLLLGINDGVRCVKITDFGLACEKQLSQGHTVNMTVCGTPLWTAPEILRGQSYNEKADVFSFSLCVWELWAFTVPHHELGLPPMEVVLKVVSEDLRPTIPLSMPSFFANLVERAWVSYVHHAIVCASQLACILSPGNGLPAGASTARATHIY